MVNASKLNDHVEELAKCVVQNCILHDRIERPTTAGINWRGKYSRRICLINFTKITEHKIFLSCAI